MKTTGNCMFTNNTKGTPMNFKIVGSALVILILTLFQCAFCGLGHDPDTKSLYFYYLRNDRFASLDELIHATPSKHIPKIYPNQYFYGNKIAEYYCYLGDWKSDSLAYELWQRLLYTAAVKGECDSVLFLAKSWAKNMPNFELPKKILGMAIRAKKEEIGKKWTKKKKIQVFEYCLALYYLIEIL
jgi:hypothetical protein